MKKYIILIFVILISFTACRKDFEEMNSNPHGFTTASDGALFNQVIASLRLGWNEQFYIHNEIFYKQTQLAALAKEAWGNTSLGTEEIWSNYYNTLVIIRELESRFGELDETPEIINMKAMVKVLLAYKTFKLTDLFGDIPFFNAGKGFESLDNLQVEFDSQRDIYLFLLDELKWVEENIDETAGDEPLLTFTTFDKLFYGSMGMWRKFANSLRLRYAMRMSEKEPTLAGEIIQDIVENELPIIYGYDFITYKGESVTLWPYALGYKNDSKFWSFSEHDNLRMGSNIWSMMTMHDSTDGSGIFDVRAYYFFDTNNEGEWVPYPQISDASVPTIGGIPYEGHRDNNIDIKGEGCIYSPFNYFLIRDRDNIPEILITGSEIHFIKAEAYERGIGVTQDQAQADIEYMQGIECSIRFWKSVMEGSTLPDNPSADFNTMMGVPGYLTDSYLIGMVGMWNATTDEERLQFIYTQRWIDHFRQPWEAFALTRRTMDTPREGDDISYYNLQIPPSETEYNSTNFLNAYGSNSTGNKVWWMN